MTLEIDQNWTYLLTDPEGRKRLEAVLPAYLPRCRWFQSKAREVDSIQIADAIPMEGAPTQLVFLSISYKGAHSEVYLLPVKFVTGKRAQDIKAANPTAEITRLKCFYNGIVTEGSLIDAVYDGQFRENLLYAIEDEAEMTGDVGSVEADTTSALESLHEAGVEEQSRVMGREQSNTSIKYGNSLILKIMRKLEGGVSPELEIGRFLTEETAITHVPLLAGFMEYRRGRRAPVTLAVLQGFIPNSGDAWEFTLNWLNQWLQSGILTQKPEAVPDESLVLQAQRDIPEAVCSRLGDYLEKAQRLGERTAELHVALASGAEDKFRPEPFTMEYQQMI
jgi:trehalose synthase-fused probable maltokinase